MLSGFCGFRVVGSFCGIICWSAPGRLNNWKKKKLNWLKSIAKTPGVVPIGRVQVVEVYSPERVAKVAKEMGMEAGLSMDLVTGWNFDKSEDREMAERYIREYRPTFLIGSPMCTMFSQLQALNMGKDPEKYQEKLRKAERHIQFVVKLYRAQMDGGRYFIHEHPAGATSWRLPCVRKLWKGAGVRAVVADL